MQGDQMMLSLDDIGAHARESIVGVAAKYMCIPYVDQEI
jgi:hypothetical protein